MLVDHAKAQRVRIRRPLDRGFPPIDNEAAFVGSVITQQAFHQCGFARAVFAQQAMHAAGRDFQRHIRQGMEAAEMFADADRLDADAPWRREPVVGLMAIPPGTLRCR